MDTDKTIKYWLAGAEDALITAGHLFEKEHYHYALFFGHLVLEKVLKALVVRKTNQHADYTHNLVALAKAAGLVLSDGDFAFLTKATEFNLEARYPEDLEKLRKLYNKEFSTQALKNINSLFNIWRKILTI